ncbi:retrovirus-related Pol polyprotein from transposon TNT 1-94 [Trifolium medium]|uniref:Retrovirus-related Pol polyprotein from transposon TNT 1-94 n=1 Tax=Trifolium medium TaxID=97028 RepID=A0A392NYU7_9FABA|nr:retrovirus-related Pol polyprotein from transposon TNT 1-94 [Trifolium medium]
MPLEGPDQIFIGSGQVSKFCHDNSVFFKLHSDVCYVKSQEASDILLQGRVGRDGLYEFPHLRFIQSPASSPT